ncbi:hypothetical protein PGTUg99_000006, partial [Puccinia graminis f. sp. tritici]
CESDPGPHTVPIAITHAKLSCGIEVDEWRQWNRICELLEPDGGGSPQLGQHFSPTGRKMRTSIRQFLPLYLFIFPSAFFLYLFRIKPPKLPCCSPQTLVDFLLPI